MEAKTGVAALEVVAAFLKEKKALNMAAEELELKKSLAKAKEEERIYEQMNKEELFSTPLQVEDSPTVTVSASVLSRKTTVVASATPSVKVSSSGPVSKSLYVSSTDVYISRPQGPPSSKSPLHNHHGQPVSTHTSPYTTHPTVIYSAGDQPMGIPQTP